MDTNRIEHIRHNLEAKDTDELLQIWTENDRQAWTEEAFEAIRQILESRGVEPGPQGQPAAAGVAAQPTRPARPGCVTAFAILMVAGAALLILRSILGIALSSSVGNYLDMGDTALAEFATTACLAVPYLAVAVGLWLMKNWARIGVIVLLSLNLVLLVALLFTGALAFPALFGLLVNGYCLYWFAAHGEHFRPPALSEPEPPVNPEEPRAPVEPE
jgi:hypothetical protein